MNIEFARLTQEDNGQLTLLKSNGERITPVVPVLAFPFTAPDEDISLVDEHGKEVMCVKALNEFDATSAALLCEHIKRREFRPGIEAILSVSTFSTPSVWQVRTQEGFCEFELRSEESIRVLEKGRLVLTHGNGMQFLIEDVNRLDKKSRQILARFMV